MSYRIAELDIEDVRKLKEKGLNQTIIAQRLGVSRILVYQKFKILEEMSARSNIKEESASSPAPDASTGSQ